MAEVRLADLILCDDCKDHGVFQFRDGTTSAEFFSQEEAIPLLLSACLDRKIVYEEVLLLVHKLSMSQVPYLGPVREAERQAGVYPQGGTAISRVLH